MLHLYFTAQHSTSHLDEHGHGAVCCPSVGSTTVRASGAGGLRPSSGHLNCKRCMARRSTCAVDATATQRVALGRLRCLTESTIAQNQEHHHETFASQLPRSTTHAVGPTTVQNKQPKTQPSTLRSGGVPFVGLPG